jgi:hypothetical protein
MPKIDLKKELKHLYEPSVKDFAIVDVPPMNFLMIDGQGDPNTAQEYKESIEALYAMSYTLKFMAKKDLGTDYTVMALEGLWWADDIQDFITMNKDAWKWTSMMMQPDLIIQEMVERAIAEVRKKKDPPALSKMRFERFDEGKSVQIMHIGPYSEEGPTIARMHAYIHENGYTENGKHHEIYLSDPRRTDPGKWRTVIRHPIKPA